MTSEIQIDARSNPKTFRKASVAAVGVKPLPPKDKLQEAYETDTTPPQFLQGHGSVPRFVVGKKPAPWDEIQSRVFKFSGPDERAEFARQAMLDGRAPHLRSDIEELSEAGLRNHLTAWIAWAEQEPFPSTLQSTKPSAWHKVRDAYVGDRILVGKNASYAEGRIQIKIGKEYDQQFAEEPQVILIEHDWARAFKGAADFDEGEFPLPYERCAFEFRLSGKRVIVLTFGYQCTVITEIGADYWVASDLGPLIEIKESRRYGALHANIRAVCIALDAEVAVTDVVRAPHRLNLSREKQGKLPINDYHVINLSKRSRVEALPSSEYDEVKWHPRLHFRRGHWRHYENHKTWIKWVLVGDPDLGFIDKEYRA